MPALLEVQDALRRQFLEGENPDVISFIEGGALSPHARLNIYHNTFVGTLTTALRLNFPAVYALVGSGYFEYVASAFIKRSPPTSAYLNDYGRDFPAFLESEETARGVPYLPDMARLEWAVSQAFHAPDADSLDLQRLASVAQEDQEHVVFALQPNVGLVASRYPIDVIWQAVLAKDDEAMAGIDLESGGVKLRVERRHDQVEVTRCGLDEWRFASGLVGKRCFGELASDLNPETATALLSDYLVRGRITAFTLAQHQYSERLP
ncbi:MAG: DNA-binding domain-containing protein [Rhodospirillaceae bacterium]|nr:DNA-binding domain-containing protein [Rhodospirillaceae bacterium]